MTIEIAASELHFYTTFMFIGSLAAIAFVLGMRG